MHLSDLVALALLCVSDATACDTYRVCKCWDTDPEYQTYDNDITEKTCPFAGGYLESGSGVRSVSMSAGASQVAHECWDCLRRSRVRWDTDSLWSLQCVSTLVNGFDSCNFAKNCNNQAGLGFDAKRYTHKCDEALGKHKGPRSVA
ncbi:hypothetical protein Tdes44962_MAKER08273 [Teratosphaeria destructans]|uniref:Uncharacterized protein n=1 Tax=Teratosphaeria destructans TaxID=418781 RepID=A0A9W7SX62_9PEZI|nr:hypothetical protein Tdes44962_MAKER08273 [Teratosphaeria destructans]